MNENKTIEIPFGAKDSELKGWEYTIPEGMEAEIKDGKVIVREKESEDERMIRIIGEAIYTNEAQQLVKTKYGLELTNLAEWLEKQGSQNLANSAKTCKDEPKFKVGDWVVNKCGNLWRIDGSDKKNYQVSNADGEYCYFPISKQDEMRLWTIQDAKGGDVLVASDGSIFLFKDVIDDACKHYIALTTDNDVKINERLKHYWETSRAVHPATKEQRDLLFQKMKEAGYEWDAEKKELKKIEQNPAWSEEDKDNLYHINALIEDSSLEVRRQEYLSGWLKSLKGRVQPQPKHEWGEKDETILEIITSVLEVNFEPNERFSGYEEYMNVDLINWLKSLKERALPQPKQEWSQTDNELADDAIACVTRCYEEYNKEFYQSLHHNTLDIKRWLIDVRKRLTPQWKPSDEHIKALEHVLLSYIGAWQPEIQSLLNDLKKLTE